MTETPQPPIEEEPAGGKQIPSLTPAIKGGAVVLGVVGAFVALVVLLAVWPQSGPKKDSQNILAAVNRAGKLYDRAQKLMANVVFTDAAGRITAPFTSNLVTRPEQIKLLGPTTPNPKALDNINEAVDGLQQVLVDNRSAGEDVKALAHSLLSGLLALKGHYYTAESLTGRAGATNLLKLAEQAIGVMRMQMATIEQYDRPTAVGEDDLKAMRAKAVAEADDLKAKRAQVSREIIGLGEKVAGIRASTAALAAKARAARNKSRITKGEEGVDLLEQALAYERQIDGLAGKIGEAQDQLRVLAVEFEDLGLREVLAREQAKVAEAILDSRKQETAERLAEGDECRKLLGKSGQSADDLVDKIVQLCTQAKSAEAKAVSAYVDADSQLDAAKAGKPARYAQYEADKADIAMAIADLGMERLSLQARLELLATSITDLWPKLSPPRPVPPAVPKLTGYVADVEKLRGRTTAAYRNAARRYFKAIESADGIHKWVYQGRLAVAHLGLYRLVGDTDELDKADQVINQALQGKESSPHLEPVLRLRRLVRADRRGPVSSPGVPPSTAPTTDP